MTSRPREDTSVTTAEPRRRTSHWRLLPQLAGLVAAVAMTVVLLPRVAGTRWADIWSVLDGVAPLTLVALGAVWACGMVAHTITLTAALPTLGRRRALTLLLVSGAVAGSLPLGGLAGVAVKYRIVRSWGHGRAAFTAFQVLTVMVETAAKVALPLVVIPVVVFTSGTPIPHLGLVLAGAMLMLAGVAGCSTWALCSSRLRRRPGLSEVQDHCRQVLQHAWWQLAAGAGLYLLLLFVLLWGCLRATGAEVPASLVLAGFATERILTMVELTPAGAGVVELGLTGVLVVLGGPAAAVVPGVLLYRGLNVGLRTTTGTLVAAGWVMRSRSDRRPDVTPGTRDRRTVVLPQPVG